MAKILAADIGGTNSRFAGFTIKPSGELVLDEVNWLQTKESLSFADLLENLNAGDFQLSPDEADVAVFAIAGPVEGGVRSSPPFITWDIDISDAEKDFGIRHALLINDFVAQAYACRSVIGQEARQIKAGLIRDDGAAAVIGAGTALGKAVIAPDGRAGYIAIASEGGHASCSFESAREFEFGQFLKGALGDSYITWNKVVSGSGLAAIHRFLTGEEMDPSELVQRILPDSETLQWASRFYARACRNFALETLSLGGLYIAGGVAARTPELVTHSVFAEEFTRSDTLAALLESIPVFLIEEQNAGLWGSALLGRQMLAR